MRCARCGDGPLGIYTGSYFDTSLICLRCEVVEREHPHYERAVLTEEAAVRRGEMNFPGVGVPHDLVQRCRAVKGDAS